MKQLIIHNSAHCQGLEVTDVKRELLRVVLMLKILPWINAGTSYSAEGGAVGGNQSSTLEQNTGHSAPATPFSDEDIAQNVSPCPKGTSTLGDSTVSSDANLHGPQQLPTIPPDGSLPDQFTVNPSANGIDGSGSLMVDGNQGFEERGTAVSDEHLVAGSEEQLSVSSNISSHSDDSTSGK